MPLGKRDKDKVKPEERAAAVDQVRAYMQALIDRGAKSCQDLLPQPEPAAAHARRPAPSRHRPVRRRPEDLAPAPSCLG